MVFNEMGGSDRFKGTLIRIAAAGGAVAVLGALAVVFSLALVPRSQARPADYLAYSFEGLDSIPEDKIFYREETPVSVPDNGEDALSAVCLLPGGGFAVSGGRTVFIFDGKKTLIRTIAAAEPVAALAASPPADAPDSSPVVLYLGMRDHVEVYGLDGRRRDEWAPLGERARIVSLAAGRGLVYAADAGNKNIACFDSGGKLLRFIALKSAKGSGFLVPGVCFDIALDASGGLWAVDPGRLRVLKLSPAGEIFKAWGRASPALDGFSGCCNPVHLALLSDGGFVVQEKGLTRIKLYDADGAFRGVVAGGQSFHESLSSLDLAAGPDETVYAVDAHLKSVRIFVKKGEK